MLGLQNGVIRFGAKFRNDSPSDLKSTLINSIGISLVSGTIIGAIIFVAAPWLANAVYNKPELEQVFRGFAFGFPLAIALWVSSAATRISKDMKYSVFSEDFMQPFSNLVLILIFSILGLTLMNSIVSNVISFGIGLASALLFIALIFTDAIKEPYGQQFSVKELLVFSIPTGFAGTFTILTAWTSRLFVGIYRPAYEAGIYQTASQISLVFVIILNALNTIFAPMIADLYNRNYQQRINELYKVSTKWGLYIIAPLFVVLLLFPAEFMIAVFGIKYSPGALPMIILATTQVVNVGTGAVGFLLIMTGHQNNWFLTSGTTMVLCVVLNAVLVPIYGMVGAAIATAIAVSGLYIAGLVQVKKILGFWPYDRRYIKGLIALLFAIIILFIQSLLLDLAPFPEILVSILLSYLTFSVLLLLLGLDNEDKEFIKIIVSKIKRTRG
jgi:O-antigen/teichoic acid export membrane protein